MLNEKTKDILKKSGGVQSDALDCYADIRDIEEQTMNEDDELDLDYVFLKMKIYFDLEQIVKRYEDRLSTPDCLGNMLSYTFHMILKSMDNDKNLFKDVVNNIQTRLLKE